MYRPHGTRLNLEAVIRIARTGCRRLDVAVELLYECDTAAAVMCGGRSGVAPLFPAGYNRSVAIVMGGRSLVVEL